LKVIDSEGLHGYIDVECLRNELSEATGMTSVEMVEAAHQLMTSQTAAGGSRARSTSSDRSSNELWPITDPRPINGNLHEYEFSV